MHMSQAIAEMPGVSSIAYLFEEINLKSKIFKIWETMMTTNKIKCLEFLQMPRQFQKFLNCLDISENE
jgi:hypothetical protein